CRRAATPASVSRSLAPSAPPGRAGAWSFSAWDRRTNRPLARGGSRSCFGGRVPAGCLLPPYDDGLEVRIGIGLVLPKLLTLLVRQRLELVGEPRPRTGYLARATALFTVSTLAVPPPPLVGSLSISYTPWPLGDLRQPKAPTESTCLNEIHLPPPADRSPFWSSVRFNSGLLVASLR